MPTTGRKMQFAAVAAILSLSASFARAEDESAAVFKQLAPRVVLLKNAEGSGTGILISEGGLILTNSYLATSPLPYTVIVDQPGKNQTAVYKKKVEILGVHPKLDLALIKIDPAENRLKLEPAEIAKTKPVIGEGIFVISNPPANSKSASKSITAGVVTAVDRQVDGQNYFQTDANISPASTGGPVCDRSGKMLGIVTYKYSEVDATAYVIPLDKIESKDFVSLAERKSDMTKKKRAAEFLLRGDRYTQLAADTLKAEGPDSIERAYYSGAAAYCFRLALAEDPGNPGLYYNIGMLLRTIDETDVGRAYLIRTVQLDPWGNPLGDAYRELGLTFATRKLDDEALAAWREGVAKFPLAGKIWEDMAICHAGRNEFADAAYCARVALTTSETMTRKDMLMQLEKKARSKLDAKDLAEIDVKISPAKILAMFKETAAVSNDARRAKKLYVTEKFAALIEKVGGAPIKGVAEKIPQTPIEVPENRSKNASAEGELP